MPLFLAKPEASNLQAVEVSPNATQDILVTPTGQYNGLSQVTVKSFASQDLGISYNDNYDLVRSSGKSYLTATVNVDRKPLWEATSSNTFIGQTFKDISGLSTKAYNCMRYVVITVGAVEAYMRPGGTWENLPNCLMIVPIDGSVVAGGYAYYEALTSNYHRRSRWCAYTATRQGYNTIRVTCTGFDMFDNTDNFGIPYVYKIEGI